MLRGALLGQTKKEKGMGGEGKARERKGKDDQRKATLVLSPSLWFSERLIYLPKKTNKILDATYRIPGDDQVYYILHPPDSSISSIIKKCYRTISQFCFAHMCSPTTYMF